MPTADIVPKVSAPAIKNGAIVIQVARMRPNANHTIKANTITESGIISLESLSMNSFKMLSM